MKAIYIGIMTGTSVDAIDIALAEFDSNDKEYIKLIAYGEYPFSEELQEYLKSMSGNIAISELSQLNIWYSDEIARKVEQFIKENHTLVDEVRAIGFHGQTIWHQPEEKLFLKKPTSSTYQLGSGTHLAIKTGIDVVNDFRTADMSLNGQGAPLVPIFDYYFLKESDKDVIVLNIGGIANITYLKKGSTKAEVIAFDTGPGNCLIDLVMRKRLNRNYDENGKIGRSGKLNEKLLDKLMIEPYISAEYPKSTGKELFNFDLIEKSGGFTLSTPDLICTLTHFTAKSIAENIRVLADNEFILKLAGGGARNSLLVELLNAYCPSARIEKTILNGIDISDSREALLMALLAHKRVEQECGNLPSVTGASRECVLGSLSVGR